MINKKGFTLIELLAVITILGILMLVAIPAVSRTIENARKNTFITTAQTYVEAVRNEWAADEISCQIGSDLKVASALPSDNQYYYVPFNTDSTGGTAYNNATSLISFCIQNLLSIGILNYLAIAPIYFSAVDKIGGRHSLFALGQHRQK